MVGPIALSLGRQLIVSESTKGRYRRAVPPTALIMGTPTVGCWQLPGLLSRCGFDTDLISMPSRFFRTGRYLRHRVIVPTPREVLKASVNCATACEYDWVIVSKDELLAMVRSGPGLTDRDRMSVAPVVALEHLGHLASKIELSRRLALGGVPTPEFRVAQTPEESVEAAAELGFPVTIKDDMGNSGTGVRWASSPIDVKNATRELNGPPFLVQKWVAGQATDMSAVFMDTKVILTTCSQELQRLPDLGPSSVRRYLPSTERVPALIPTLDRLGTVLGLHGFATITAIDSADGTGLTFIEVDVRPNAWVTQGQHVGDDPVVRLRHWWATGDSIATVATSEYPRVSDVRCYFRRMPRKALLSNQHGVWRGFPAGNPDAWLLASWSFLRGPG